MSQGSDENAKDVPGQVQRNDSAKQQQTVRGSDRRSRHERVAGPLEDRTPSDREHEGVQSASGREELLYVRSRVHYGIGLLTSTEIHSDRRHHVQSVVDRTTLGRHVRTDGIRPNPGRRHDASEDHRLAFGSAIATVSPVEIRSLFFRKVPLPLQILPRNRQRAVEISNHVLTVVKRWRPKRSN